MILGVQDPRALYAKFLTCQPMSLLWPIPRVVKVKKSYLGIIRNLISYLKSGEGEGLSTPQVNLISFRHLEPSHYQKVLDGYEVGYLNWSSKDLVAIEMYLTLINQCRCLVK